MNENGLYACLPLLQTAQVATSNLFKSDLHFPKNRLRSYVSPGYWPGPNVWHLLSASPETNSWL